LAVSGAWQGERTGAPRHGGPYLFQVRDGKVIKLADHVDREHTLADLGLEV